MQQSGGQALSTYRLSLAHVLRALAPLSVLLGAGWLVVSLLDLQALARGFWTGVTGVALALCAIVLLRPPALLRLTVDGYQISLVRGAGAKVARWADVMSVATQPVGGATCLVIMLRGGRTSVLPLSLLGACQGEAERDVQRRLDSAHGRRRVDRL
ncbi:MAG: hypothetical protein H0T14_03530 [Nocardioidaceae bacterium]|nr:hypothetical protein [Nocardioidaceae bacterium]